eukprot:2070319-Pyramimonas_sp.AAC.1
MGSLCAAGQGRERHLRSACARLAFRLPSRGPDSAVAFMRFEERTMRRSRMDHFRTKYTRNLGERD